MLEQRVAAHPDRVLFRDAREPDTQAWTYAQVAWYTRTLAGVFLGASPDPPRVAILAEHVFFYRVPVADDETRRQYLERSYDLGRRFAES